ncbi:MAG: hypothetical protein ABJE95_22710 [Byssovorax sp.]
MSAPESTLLRLTAIAGIFLLGACGAPAELTSSTSTTGAAPTDPVAGSPASSPAALVAACTEYHAAHREWFQRCEGYDLGQPTVDALTQRCATRAVLPGMTLSAEVLTECAASFSVATCGYVPPRCLTAEGFFRSRRTWSIRTIPLGGIGPYDDYTLFPRSNGAAPAGSPCDFFDQCQSGWCSSSYSQCGVCMELVTAGEACSPSAVCASGNCISGICVPELSAVGQACGFVGKGGDRSTCPSEDYCDANTSGDKSGVCQARLAPGDACFDPGFSSENRCIDGALCRVGHCVAILVGKEGQSCDGDVVVCEEGMVCDQSTCRKPTTEVHEGGSCAVNRCAPPLFCDSRYSVCAARHEPGGACAPNRLCSPDATCSAEGVCVALPGEGAQCNPGPERCASGLICGDFTCVRLVGDGAPCPKGFECDTPFACREGVCRTASFCSTPPKP